MLYTDLRELKSLLDIDPNNTAEDKNLNFLVEQASQWIEEIINRPGMSKQSRTEYYSGTGTQRLLLKSRPVYTTPAIQVFVDGNAYYGSTSGAFTNSNSQLNYGVDFALQIDQEGGTSRSGILIRINNYWEKPSYRERGYLSPFLGPSWGSIKIIYTAGYTVDDLPASFRLACNLLVSKLRMVMPLGLELNSESYEDRSISIVNSEKNRLLPLVMPMLINYRNWKW